MFVFNWLISRKPVIFSSIHFPGNAINFIVLELNETLLCFYATASLPVHLHDLRSLTQLSEKAPHRFP